MKQRPRYVIVPAQDDDILALAPRLRAADVDEIRAASGLSPADALRQSFDLSTHVWVAKDRLGQPIALWGVGPLSLVLGKGCPWLLASAAFDDYGRDIGRLSRRFLAGVRAIYPTLENRVDARHVRAIRWLAWLGFTIEEPEPWGVEARPFHRFWI